MKEAEFMARGAIRWENGELIIIDQTALPTELVELKLDSLAEVWDAIKTLKIRGAPAIGVCAAFGILVGFRERQPHSLAEAVQVVREVAGHLATARPTAVNLFWSLSRMVEAAGRLAHADNASAAELDSGLEREAIAIYEDDRRRCRAIGDHGAPLIRDGDGVLTHCNAGALAASEYGTALAVLFRAHELGRKFRVYADETRPLLQGARLTAWELLEAGIDVTLICDSVAAQVMREGKVNLVVVGADRIAANGDTANKIGTYNLAVLAQAHHIPFYVAAPFSTVDLSVESGVDIPIEQRDPKEVTEGWGKRTAPERVEVYNPAFDVTPADLITGIVTEKGILRPPYNTSIASQV
jgi:methylthioribose-1-phosphate isomerase